MSRKALLRAVACAAVVIGTFAGAGVHTAAAVTVSDPCGGPSSDTIDPQLTQNKLTAIPNTTRPYADICSVTAIHSGSSLDYTIAVAAPMPSFPTTVNGDTGVYFQACVDIDPTSPLAQGPTVVGIGRHGSPVYDGPYDSGNGWKICAGMSIQALNVTECTASIYDPMGRYTLFDRGQFANMPACSAAVGSPYITFSMPLTWQIRVPPPPPPFQGFARTTVYNFIPAAANNLVVVSQVYTGVTLPFNACFPAPTCSLVGPIQGVGGLLTTVDWAPGQQLCTTPVLSCIDNPGGFTLGLLPLGFPSAMVYCPSVAPNTCPNPIAGFVYYDWCQPTSSSTGQDMGDLYALAPALCGGPVITPYPYHYEAANGRLIPNAGGQQIPQQFLRDGVNF
jgi:hypothetical protein